SAAGYEDVLNVSLDVFRIAAVLLPVLAGSVTYGILRMTQHSEKNKANQSTQKAPLPATKEILGKG
ncbi:MAG TPA: hypothetical protein VI688_01800, partial [Anaerolineales bacterium]|nr:hypothetical protein [Anaerolineales bacterium]